MPLLSLTFKATGLSATSSHSKSGAEGTYPQTIRRVWNTFSSCAAIPSPSRSFGMILVNSPSYHPFQSSMPTRKLLGITTLCSRFLKQKIVFDLMYLFDVWSCFVCFSYPELLLFKDNCSGCLMFSFILYLIFVLIKWCEINIVCIFR